MVDVAIIGGTGIGSRLMERAGQVLHVPTPEGLVRGKLLEVQAARVLLLSRHSAGHKVPPHLVNYRAMALALARLQVKACLATAAVGSLRRNWKPGTMVVCSDFLDVTARHATLFDRQVVHTDFSDPFPARRHLLAGAAEVDQPVEDGGVYLCANGPRYETPHEIEVYEKLGADVVGMTAATEAIAMREAGVPYGCLAVVTNLAAGYEDEPLSHEEVVTEMERAGERAVAVLLAAVGKIVE